MTYKQTFFSSKKIKKKKKTTLKITPPQKGKLLEIVFVFIAAYKVLYNNLCKH